ncbi:MAG: hypothetical protein K8R67_16740 [Desulfobacteraceae bacterium]|nr:hypothetical protein [Desulfobacteraceae bacterium]
MKKLIVLIILLFLTASANAQIATEKGVGQIGYKGWGTPSAKVKQEAIQKAKLNALIRFTANFGQAKTLNFEKIRGTVEGEIDKYIPDYNIIDDNVDKKSKIYKVIIQASINSSLIDVELQKVSAVQNTIEDEKSYLSFVFVAREAKTVKKFDKRKVVRTVEESSEDQTEISNVEEGELKLSAENKTDKIKTTGGSTTQKSDQIQYDVSNASEINTAMSNVFATAGFEVVDAEFLADETEGLVDVEKFIEDFKYGDDITGKTRREAVKGCRAVDVLFFSIGTLDVGMKDIDPVSGLTRVFVSVTGKVLSLKKRFPKTVASVGPVQFSGLGPDQTVAKRNALKLAAEKAANELVSQLRAKNIK